MSVCEVASDQGYLAAIVIDLNFANIGMLRRK